MSEQGLGWFIVEKTSGGISKDGPYRTSQMEAKLRNGELEENTLVAHPKYTKGKALYCKKIARFYDILASVTDVLSERQHPPESTVTLDNTSPGIPSAATPSVPAVRASEPAASEPPISAELMPIARSRDEVGIGRFMADGQDPSMVLKLVERVEGICTREEYPLYMAIQQRPIANFSPDAVVLTNRRAIVFRQKILGRLQFLDVLWKDVRDVHFSENLIGATISIRGLNGHVELMEYLPKPQARKVYRIAQEMEEKMVEFRRDRAMEERKAGAANIVVNNDLGALAAPQAPKAPEEQDDLSKLQRLKVMLDQGLISAEEFDEKKREILARM